MCNTQTQLDLYYFPLKIDIVFSFIKVAPMATSKYVTSTLTLNTAAGGEERFHGNVEKPTRRWYHWHEPGTSKEEKWLLFKLDFFVLSYTCLVCHTCAR